MSIKSALSTDQEKAAETGRFSGTAEIRAISGLIKLVGFRKKSFTGLSVRQMREGLLRLTHMK
jgi:hypothetical protein